MTDETDIIEADIIEAAFGVAGETVAHRVAPEERGVVEATVHINLDTGVIQVNDIEQTFPVEEQ